MKIVVDDQIPWVDELFAGQVTLIKKPGSKITRRDVLDAQALWVRTLTVVDAELLNQTGVRFVGSATAGYDHLDIEWLEQHDIAWAYAAGANAQAVSDYVICCIAALRVQGFLNKGRMKVGIIGAGHVGRLVSADLNGLVSHLIMNDPPRAANEPGFISTPLAQFEDLDLICIHPALTYNGAYPSYHLLDHDFFRRQKAGCVVINAARGEIIATQVMLKNPHLHWCLDVWENEPALDCRLLEQALIATPHIAGYSISAKRNASLCLYQKTCEFFNLPYKKTQESSSLTERKYGKNWESKVLAIYDPLVHSEQMRKKILSHPHQVSEKFMQLRQEYSLRSDIQA